MLDLKNCPFCGGAAKIALQGMTFITGPHDQRYYAVIECEPCGVSICGEDSANEDDARPLAIAAWNRRALQAVGPEPVGQISDEIADAVREAYRRKVAEYDRDFRDPAMSGEPWKTKYGTNLHSTSLGEQWAMSQALRSALVATPPAERVVETLREAREFIDDERPRSPDRAHPNDRDEIEERNAFRPKLIAQIDAALATKPAVKDDETVVEALRGATASLVAAVSLLKRGSKKAAPSDKMFDQMILDYEKSIKEARAALAAKDGRS